MSTIRLAVHVFALCAFATSAARAQADFRISLDVQPPQEIRALTLRSASGDIRSYPVRDGAVLVPKTFSMPWRVALLRFEPISYSATDLQRGAPLLLRELGELSVRLRPEAGSDEARAYLVRNGESSPGDVPLLAGVGGAYRATVPAGIYATAFVSETRATRIRSGVVITPGKTTEIGEVAFERTGSVTLRVIDERSRRPIAGARVTWSPPDALNAAVARVLFSRLWSATTDRAGIATFRSIGPPPIPAQWFVTAAGYARGLTARAIVAEARRITLSDVALRAESTLIVDAQLPRDDVFREALLVVSLPEADDSPRFKAVMVRQALRSGHNTVRLTDYGRMRFSIESKNGRRLYFHDADVSPSDRRIVIAPVPTEITGAVRRSDRGVEDVLITAADRHDARTIIGQTRTDADGAYTLRVYQTGHLLLYTNAPRADAVAMQSVLKDVELAGEREVRVDFELPTAGASIVVVDAESRMPLNARLRGRLVQDSGASRGIYVETDKSGRAKIDGAPEGKATLFVRSSGHRGREITVDVVADAADVTVALSRGGLFAGRVIDANGAPVRGARILGGYASPTAVQASFEATSDVSGRFEITEGPESATRFFVVARGQAVGIANLHETDDNVVQLSPPNAGAVTLVAGGRRPATLSLLLPAPRGDAIIPFDVFRTLGELNGMSPFQLLSGGSDGTLVLPEFLPPGSYTLYDVRPTGKPNAEQFVRVADISVPAAPHALISLPE